MSSVMFVDRVIGTIGGTLDTTSYANPEEGNHEEWDRGTREGGYEKGISGDSGSAAHVDVDVGSPTEPDTHTQSVSSTVDDPIDEDVGTKGGEVV